MCVTTIVVWWSRWLVVCCCCCCCYCCCCCCCCASGDDDDDDGCGDMMVGWCGCLLYLFGFICLYLCFLEQQNLFVWVGCCGVSRLCRSIYRDSTSHFIDSRRRRRRVEREIIHPSIPPLQTNWRNMIMGRTFVSFVLSINTTPHYNSRYTQFPLPIL